MFLQRGVKLYMIKCSSCKISEYALFFLNEQAQTVLISINKEGSTGENHGRFLYKIKNTEETVQRAAQAGR